MPKYAGCDLLEVLAGHGEDELAIERLTVDGVSPASPDALGLQIALPRSWFSYFGH